MPPALPSVQERIRGSSMVSTRAGTRELQFHAMGTRCRVVYATSGALAQEFATAVLEWVARFESRYSRFLPESLISRINCQAGAGWVEIDEQTEHIFALCDEAHFLTRGVFDPTALPLIQLWNWKASPPVIPSEAQISKALELVGWRKVQRAHGKVFLPRSGMSIDLGGIGKEYAVDCVANLARQYEIAGVLVDFGQDVFAVGVPGDDRPAWHVGLEDPKQLGKCWAGLAVKNQAVATSGDYIRRFEFNGKRYGHILDVRNGRPVDNGCRSVTVIAPTCTLAGLFSTAAFVLGPEEGIRLIEATPNVHGCVTHENRRTTTRRFYEHVVS